MSGNQGDGARGHAEAGLPDDAIRRVRERALRLLAVRDRTRWELEQRLVADADPEVVDEVLAWLEHLGYLDDERFATEWIHARKGRYGPLRLEKELRDKGLPRDRARELVDTLAGDEDALEDTALALVQGRVSDCGGDPDAHMRMKRRLAAFLHRRGFPPRVALRAVERAAQACIDSLTAEDS